MPAPSPLERLLNRAKQRHLINVAVAEFGLAACIAAAGAILLLVFGTQILNWYWPALLVAVAFGVAASRIRQRALSEYRIAQAIDRKLDLKDAVSTAYHFSREASKPSPLVAYQLADANRVSESADVHAAVPFEFSRSLYVLCGLVVVAGTLFAVRYGTTHSLTLRAPIANLHFNPFSKPATRNEVATTKSVIQEKLEQQMQQLGIPLDDPTALTSNDPLAMKAASALATPDGKEPMAAAEKGQATSGKPDQQGDNVEGNEPGESSSAGTGKQPGDQESAGNSPQSSPGKPPANAQNGKNGSNQASDNSLANKMRDAVANLLSKLNPSKSEGQSPSPQQGNSASQQMAQKGGQQGQGKSSAEGQGSQDQQGKQDGEAGDKQSAQSRPGDKSSEKPGNQDSKSGVGHSDGDKDVRAAEQLAAMGKISEILGKRSAQVAGEMSVEVSSGAQQLKTAYSQKRAQHADTGAEIDRDEVPLIYQPYVQKYFEEVHKASKTARPKTSAKNRVQQPQILATPSGH